MAKKNESVASHSDRLIVDVGANHGEDTRYYLSLGCRVLAIEANPSLARELTETFATELAEGRLTVAAVAVGEGVGVVDFHISADDLWSSTDSGTAGRGITSVTTVQVECVTLADLLRELPTPHYVKIDVEGADEACLRSLGGLPWMPRYLSFEAEMSDLAVTARMVDLASSYGYSGFKLVNQANHPPGFSPHSSGPFGELAPGVWVTASELLTDFDRARNQQAARIAYSSTGRVHGIPLGWAHHPLRWAYNFPVTTRIRRIWAGVRRSEVGGWFDIHCMLGDSTRPTSTHSGSPSA